MTDTTDPVEAVARATFETLRTGLLAETEWADLGEGWKDGWREGARTTVAVLAALGAVMPDEAAKLREENAGYASAVEFYDGAGEQVTARLDEAEATVAALRVQVADALALCTQTRPDSVIGTSDTDRLNAVRERLAMPVGGGDRG